MRCSRLRRADVWRHPFGNGEFDSKVEGGGPLVLWIGDCKLVSYAP